MLLQRVGLAADTLQRPSPRFENVNKYTLITEPTGRRYGTESLNKQYCTFGSHY